MYPKKICRNLIQYDVEPHQNDYTIYIFKLSGLGKTIYTTYYEHFDMNY